jgi:hypothetical protein
MRDNRGALPYSALDLIRQRSMVQVHFVPPKCFWLGQLVGSSDLATLRRMDCVQTGRIATP